MTRKQEQLRHSAAKIRSTYRDIILALIDDPRLPIRERITESQIESLRYACRRATGRSPWSTVTTYQGAARVDERILDPDAIRAWGDHDEMKGMA